MPVTLIKNCEGVLGSSVGTIMVKFKDSLSQRSEVQISIRSSYSEKMFYEKKNFYLLPKTKIITMPVTRYYLASGNGNGNGACNGRIFRH